MERTPGRKWLEGGWKPFFGNLCKIERRIWGNADVLLEGEVLGCHRVKIPLRLYATHRYGKVPIFGIRALPKVMAMVRVEKPPVEAKQMA